MKISELKNIIKECVNELLNNRELVFKDKKSWAASVKSLYPKAKLKRSGGDLVANLDGNAVATWREEVGEGWVKKGISEMSTTGGVAGYNIPGAFARKGGPHAKKAMDVTKKMGYTPVKKEDRY